MADAIEAMRAGFAALSNGRAVVPVRTLIPLDRFDGGVLFMPAYMEDETAYGLKVVSIHEGNRTRGLEAVQALMVLFDASNGRLEAIMDGASVTAIRTGAGSALATDLLARRDSRVAVIFGSGVQARSHLEAICCVREIEKAFVVSRSREHAHTFADEMSTGLDIEVKVADDASVSKNADVICTTTTATEPILHLNHVRKGVHINAVGTHRPHDAEIGKDLVAAAKVVVDQIEACMQEAGDILRPIRSGLIDESHIFGELGEIVTGRKPGREKEDEITLFKSVGNAIQDLAGAVAAVEKARREGFGTELQLS